VLIIKMSLLELLRLRKKHYAGQVRSSCVFFVVICLWIAL